MFFKGSQSETYCSLLTNVTIIKINLKNNNNKGSQEDDEVAPKISVILDTVKEIQYLQWAKRDFGSTQHRSDST